MRHYDPSDWYWIVSEDASCIYSSKKASFVSTNDGDYMAFLADENAASRIGTMDELRDIFRERSPGGALDLYTAAKRLEKETSGIEVNGATVATDRESQSMIANAYAYVQASGVETITYKATTGWVTLTAEEIKAVALAVGAHVQAMFAKEAQIAAALAADPPTITTREQIDAIFG